MMVLISVKTKIELHDSMVSAVARHREAVIVHFKPAYLHKSEGRQGYDPGTGWVQEAELFFTDASFDGKLPELPCNILEGELVIQGERHLNTVTVPLDVEGGVELRLTFDQLHTLRVAGRAARLRLFGEAKYVEDFPPKDGSDHSA